MGALPFVPVGEGPNQRNWDFLSLMFPLGAQYGGTPTGAISAFGGSSAPVGYLMCDGSAVSRDTYSALFDVLGTTYGSGDGSTTFNLPDLRGRTPVGEDGSAGRISSNDARGQSGGAETHTHNFAHTHAGAGATGGATKGGGVGGDTFRFGDGFLDVHSHQSVLINTTSQSTSTTGSGSNLQPYQVVNYIIKA